MTKKTNSLLISVGICTKNNPSLVNDCLYNILRQKTKRNWNIEIIVIDQSESSDTKAVVNDIKKLPTNFKIKYVKNIHKGISFSRNNLFEVSQGKYLFTVDDDVRVTENWLSSAVSLFEKKNNVGVIGGQVIPNKKPPYKFKKELKLLGYSDNFWPHALFNLGRKAKEITNNLEHYPPFANMAIKKKVYKSISIDTRFGNQEGLFKVFGGEDPDFIEKARKITRIYYLPNMKSFHIIKSSKYTKKYFLWRFSEFGKERALLESFYKKPSNFSLITIPRSLKKVVFLGGNIADYTQLVFSLNYLIATLYHKHLRF